MKFFDAERGLGFIRGDDGVEVFLHASVLPEGAAAPKPGARIEYRVADGRRDPQAPAMEILLLTHSVSAARRRKPQAMVPVVEDLIKPLDASSTALRNGKCPGNLRAVVKVLHAVADDLDTQGSHPDHVDTSPEDRSGSRQGR